MLLSAFTSLSALIVAAALAYLAAGAVMALRVTRARRQKPRRDRIPAGLEVEDVSFSARDHKARIDAWYLPAKFHRGAVIFVHGLDSCRGDQPQAPGLELAARLVDQGLSVLMLDLRGHGRSSDARLSFGEHERHDVLGAVDWLLDQGHAPGRIGVIGMSMGASTAMRAAAGEAAIGAVVADSPYADFEVMFKRHYCRLNGVPGWMLPATLLATRMLSGKSVAAPRPVEHLGGLQGRPVLVIHGGADPLIPLEEGRAMAQAVGAVMWITASCRHLGSSIEAPQVYTDVVSTFFAGHLLDESLLERRAANEGLVDWADSGEGLASGHI